MPRKVILTPDARTDLDEACDWYRERDATAAEQFLENAVQAMRDAAEKPLHHPIGFGRFRRIVLRRPYVIFTITTTPRSMSITSFTVRKIQNA